MLILRLLTFQLPFSHDLTKPFDNLADLTTEYPQCTAAYELNLLYLKKVADIKKIGYQTLLNSLLREYMQKGTLQLSYILTTPGTLLGINYT